MSATFFCVGHRVEAQPELAQRIVAEGHLLANHSDRHSHATNCYSTRRLREELVRAQETMERITGWRPTLYRPPAGLTNPRVFRVIEPLGLRVVGWTVRGMDTRWGRPEAIVKRIVRCLCPGAIIVLHDSGVPSGILLPAVEILLAELDRLGYQTERLDRLMETK